MRKRYVELEDMPRPPGIDGRVISWGAPESVLARSPAGYLVWRSAVEQGQIRVDGGLAFCACQLSSMPVGEGQVLSRKRIEDNIREIRTLLDVPDLQANEILLFENKTLVIE